MPPSFWTHGLPVTVVLAVTSLQAQSSEITTVLEKQIQEHHLAGMTAVVVRAESIVGIGSAGVRREGKSTPVDIRDLFHLGSNTKIRCTQRKSFLQVAVTKALRRRRLVHFHQVHGAGAPPLLSKTYRS